MHSRRICSPRTENGATHYVQLQGGTVDIPDGMTLANCMMYGNNAEVRATWASASQLLRIHHVSNTVRELCKVWCLSMGIRAGKARAIKSPVYSMSVAAWISMCDQQCLWVASAL